MSPWDRNRADYGDSSYVGYYRKQLTELFKNYGSVFEMWFDGANGGDGFYGGAREKRNIDGKNYYDWPATLELVKKIEPQILFFSDAGPDIRWCGNEKGYIGETNWATFSNDTIYPGKPGLNDLLNVGTEAGNKWIPAEVDVSIRPGWFYHKEEDDSVKSPERLFDIYLSSVGRGSTLLLNIPPDKRGLIHDNDVQSLIAWKKKIDQTFSDNKALKADATSSSFRGNSPEYSANKVLDDKKETYWTTDDDVKTGHVEIDLKKLTSVHFIVIQEYIKLGQRVKAFEVEAYQNGVWMKVAEGTTIGYKRILKINDVSTSKVRVKITDAKACPVISSIAIY